MGSPEYIVLLSLYSMLLISFSWQQSHHQLISSRSKQSSTVHNPADNIFCNSKTCNYSSLAIAFTTETRGRMTLTHYSCNRILDFGFKQRDFKHQEVKKKSKLVIKVNSTQNENISFGHTDPLKLNSTNSILTTTYTVKIHI